MEISPQDLIVDNDKKMLIFNNLTLGPGSTKISCSDHGIILFSPGFSKSG